ncbi:MAG: trigger factor, partial [bacterium]
MSENEDLYLKDIASPSNLKRILSFEVPREIVESEIDAILQGIRRQVELPGFRKGRAPLSIVRSQFSETARKEALERLIPEIYQKALRRHDFQPILPGEISEIEFAAGEPLRFQVEIELYPQVVLGEYKGLKVRKEVRPIEDSDIDNEIKALRERFALFERVDRQSQDGDVVIIDYWRLDDEGKPVSDSTVNNFPVDLASKDLIEDFKNALIGVSKGDSNVVDVT